MTQLSISRTLESTWLPESLSSVSKRLAWFILCSRRWLLPWYVTCLFHFPCVNLVHSSSLLELLISRSWQDSYFPVCCFLYQLPSATSAHFFINEWAPLDGDWVTSLFSMSYFIVSSVSSVVFPKVLFGSSDVACKNFQFLWLSLPFTSTRYERSPYLLLIWPRRHIGVLSLGFGFTLAKSPSLRAGSSCTVLSWYFLIVGATLLAFPLHWFPHEASVRHKLMVLESLFS